MTVLATVQTIGMAFKEYVNNIPDDINTSKDLDEYCSQFKKDYKEKKKNIKIENVENKNVKKKKMSNLDADGNEKPNRALTKYQQYMKDNQQRIRYKFPELSNNERFSKLAEEWNAFKATLGDAGDAGDAGDEKPVKAVKAPKKDKKSKKDSE